MRSQEYLTHPSSELVMMITYRSNKFQKQNSGEKSNILSMAPVRAVTGQKKYASTSRHEYSQARIVILSVQC